MKPGSARAADMRFEGAAGTTDSWVEMANHGQDGQNVLYWDGHVAFVDTVYASDNPEDNIFVYDNQVFTGKEIGGDLDAVIIRTHCDPMPPGANGNRAWGYNPW